MNPKTKIPTIVTAIVGIAAFCFLAYVVVSSRGLPSIGGFAATTSPSLDQQAGSQAAGTSTAADVPAGNDVAATTAPASAASAASFSILRTPTSVLHVLTADTDALRQQGLSGHAPLAADQGMLFVFSGPGIYGFWMKDMLFPLDMVWIRADKTVAGVTAGLSPDTYPDIFFPPSDIQYVLEINAGAAKKLGFATSTQLVF